MSDDTKTTQDSKVELTDEQLDGAEGGAGYVKFDGIDGESVDMSHAGSGKVKFQRLTIKKYADY